MLKQTDYAESLETDEISVAMLKSGSSEVKLLQSPLCLDKISLWALGIRVGAKPTSRENRQVSMRCACV